ncbi:MAG: heme o synthase [bacterium]
MGVEGPVAAPARAMRSVVADYVQISKPRILLLLLIVAWAAMFVAYAGWPAWKPFVAVTLAGTFSVASSGALNNVVERHRDARMKRTSTRPVASGRLSVRHAVTYAAVMAALSFACLAVLQLWLAAAFTVGAIAYYVVIYTVLLKPTTPQNIVIGGLAGSFPAVIGWTAATNSLAWPAVAPALVLALLVFLWTPAHFWALALLYKDDYGAADYPMMPNVRGEPSTRRQIVVYSALTLLGSLVLAVPGVGGPGLRAAGWLYLGVAVILGAVLVLRSVKMLRRHTPQAYRSFFFFTIQYLGVLLIALMVDRVVLRPA